MADNSSGSSRRRRGSSAKPGTSKTPASSGRSQGGFLTRKVFGIPLWVIVLIIVAAYYWYTHYGPGAKKQQQSKQPLGPVRRRGGGGTRVIVIRDGGGRGRRHKRHNSKASPRAATAGGGNVGGGMTAEATAPYMTDTAPPGPTGGAVTEGGAPVYAAYQQFYGAQGGDGESAAVPDPVQAYAPMTAGAIYTGPDYG